MCPVPVTTSETSYGPTMASTICAANAAGLRAAELCGLQVGDVLLPEPSLNPNAPTRRRTDSHRAYGCTALPARDKGRIPWAIPK